MFGGVREMALRKFLQIIAWTSVFGVTLAVFTLSFLGSRLVVDAGSSVKSDTGWTSSMRTKPLSRSSASR